MKSVNINRLPGARKGKEINYRKIKLFAKRGYSNNEIYKAIGIDKKTWLKWTIDPKVKEVLIKIRESLPANKLKGNGRPTEYKPEYCKMMYDYFNIKPYETEKETITFKNGDTITKEVLIPNDLPVISKFAEKIGVHRQTLRNWKKSYSEFEFVYKSCLDLQETILITNGIRGLYNPSYAILVSKNFLNMKDKKDITTNNETVKAITFITSEQNKIFPNE